ncbi:MinD/ParA family ATP-binding protein [Candidatus Halobonum tyrrellensis]|uniref:Cell division inhibitor MinD-like (ATPase involved in chromosome partitioning) n=1 Tax=Candidatus Halobonum tyrrellensis G22 TaxID=1324957 RepID=V4GSY2_9EURY|nr:cell division inhibitor MinD-like (ATPase involved in chromosome partitioning) [Candidatus Halobonum tyrrellensis]ESP88211.1 cell division inhibitor MinD-like (ATPase involved in chromosome partitioning) [Candidatus Halobonum tyrrellensis G22]
MILAVTGGKGGVGKSTLSYELGAALDAVVVDADLAMADLPGGRERGPDLHDVLAGRASAVEAVRTGPVDVLPCGRSLAGARAADVARLDEAVADLARRRDLVLDCPAGLRADAGVPLALADACVVVTSPKPWALADAVRSRELARELDAGVACIALNRAVDAPAVAPVERALGAPATVVPADPRLGRSITDETPVAATAPDSAAGRAVDAVATAVRRAR